MNSVVRAAYGVMLLCSLLMHSAAQEKLSCKPFAPDVVSIKLLKDYPHHVDALCAMWHDVLGKKTYPDFAQVKEPYTQLLRSQMQDDKLPLALIALINEEPIGLCAVRPTCIPRAGAVPWSDEHPEAQPWLAIFVAAAYQKKGVGAKLVTAAMHYAQQLGFECVYAVPENKDLEALYIRKGCTKIADTTLRGTPASVLRMELGELDSGMGLL